MGLLCAAPRLLLESHEQTDPVDSSMLPLCMPLMESSRLFAIFLPFPTESQGRSTFRQGKRRAYGCQDNSQPQPVEEEDTRGGEGEQLNIMKP